MVHPRSEFEDEYDAAMAGEDTGTIRGAILRDQIRLLEPYQALIVDETVTIKEAIEKIVSQTEPHSAVCIVNGHGVLMGIFSERDVLTRVISQDLDVDKTLVSDVMTPDPVALKASHTAAYALNQMAIGGFRNIPIVDDDHKPIGIISTRHLVKFISSLFPEQTLNLPPNEDIQNPEQQHGG